MPSNTDAMCISSSRTLIKHTLTRVLFLTQINRMTSWIDGSFVYSTSEAWVSAMRSFQNGTFKSGDSEGMPPLNHDRVPIFTAPAPHIMRMANPEKMLCKFFFKFKTNWYIIVHSFDWIIICVLVLGDPRTNQNPAILAIGVIFFRYHNVIAAKVQEEHPEWSDEEIFQRARRIVVATLQVIQASNTFHKEQ